jgi:putative peptidoglycan lipid II flippase
MLPALFGSSVSQLNMVVNTVLASFLVTGSVSWLYYSDRLMEFPLGIFGIALATVLLPNLSGRHANGDHHSFSRLMDWALRLTVMIALPATVGLVMLAGPILITLFFRGEFLPLDVEMTRNALWAFALGLLGFILVKVLAPAFYARQDTRTPAKIAAVAFSANIVLSLALIGPLQHVGLALAISGAAYLNAYLLFVRLRRSAIYTPEPGWWRLLGQVLVSCGAMGAVLYFGAGSQSTWLQAGLFEQSWRLVLWIGAGATTYGLVMFVLGIRPHHFRSPAAPSGV